MGKNTVMESCDLVVPEVVEEQVEQFYLDSSVEYLFNHVNRKLLEDYAGTVIPSSELYSNKSFSAFLQRENSFSINFKNSLWRNGNRKFFFSKTFLENFFHTQIHSAARIYYGEQPGKRSFVHGPAFRKIAKKCGVEVSVEGVHTKIREPFVSVVLEKFGARCLVTNSARNPLLITN